MLLCCIAQDAGTANALRTVLTSHDVSTASQSSAPASQQAVETILASTDQCMAQGNLQVHHSGQQGSAAQQTHMLTQSMSNLPDGLWRGSSSQGLSLRSQAGSALLRASCQVPAASRPSSATIPAQPAEAQVQSSALGSIAGAERDNAHYRLPPLAHTSAPMSKHSPTSSALTPVLHAHTEGSIAPAFQTQSDSQLVQTGQEQGAQSTNSPVCVPEPPSSLLYQQNSATAQKV